jgi:hypothetical protein
MTFCRLCSAAREAMSRPTATRLAQARRPSEQDVLCIPFLECLVVTQTAGLGRIRHTESKEEANG